MDTEEVIMADHENLPVQVQDDHQKIMAGQDTDQTRVDDNNPNETKKDDKPITKEDIYDEVKNHVWSTAAGHNILNLSLLVSNAQYLKLVLNQDNPTAKHYVVLVLVIASLLLQIVLGFIVLFNYREKRIDEKQMEEAETPQNYETTTLRKVSSGLAFLILFINVIIAVLGSE